jgi:hypothetical protein
MTVGLSPVTLCLVPARVSSPAVPWDLLGRQVQATITKMWRSERISSGLGEGPTLVDR